MLDCTSSEAGVAVAGVGFSVSVPTAATEPRHGLTLDEIVARKPRLRELLEKAELMRGNRRYLDENRRHLTQWLQGIFSNHFDDPFCDLDAYNVALEAMHERLGIK